MPTQNAIVLDTSALIDLLCKTPRGERVLKHVGNSTCYVTPLTISEAIAFTKRSKADGEQTLRALLRGCIVVETSAELAYNAGMYYAIIRTRCASFSHGDAAVVAAAQALSLPIITCDNDFATVKNAVVVQ